jgi:hypothetical protein
MEDAEVAFRDAVAEKGGAIPMTGFDLDEREAVGRTRRADVISETRSRYRAGRMKR